MLLYVVVSRGFDFAECLVAKYIDEETVICHGFISNVVNEGKVNEERFISSTPISWDKDRHDCDVVDLFSCQKLLKFESFTCYNNLRTLEAWWNLTCFNWSFNCKIEIWLNLCWCASTVYCYFYLNKLSHEHKNTLECSSCY